MADPFVSPRRTLRRAKQHVEDFHFRTIAFRKNKDWSYVIEKDDQGGAKRHKIKFNREFFEDLPGIVLDAASGLRAVLDQTGYAAAVASGVQAPKRAYFPLADDATQLENVIARRRCDDLPPEILALFRAFKPYKCGNILLWSLNKLANTKKHAFLTPIQLDRYSVAYQIPGIKVGLHHRWTAEECEVEILGWGEGSDSEF